MKRAILVTLLGLGTLVGFASGFHHVRHHTYGFAGPLHGRQERLDAFAEACVRAARHTGAPSPAP